MTAPHDVPGTPQPDTPRTPSNSNPARPVTPSGQHGPPQPEPNNISAALSRSPGIEGGGNQPTAGVPATQSTPPASPNAPHQAGQQPVKMPVWPSQAHQGSPYGREATAVGLGSGTAGAGTSATGAPPSTSSGPVVAAERPKKPANREFRLAVMALVLAGVLLIVSAVQTVLLVQLGNQLDEQRRRLADQGTATERQLDRLEQRTDALEERAKRTLDAPRVAEKVLPSVFRVIAGDASGSAFAIGGPSEGGTYLITNHHVVEHAPGGVGTRIQVDQQGKNYSATIVKLDAANDLALLEVEEQFPGLAAEKKPPAPGEPILVVGAPLGLEESVTVGVVSRTGDVPGIRGTFIQFDAAINPGNSGGPVVDAAGKVVGVARAKAQGAEAIGLAIPIEIACKSFEVC